MPPGSKKRKAAKKKKLKEPNTPITSPHHSQSHEGDDDPRDPGGKELSDGSEVSSPMSEHTEEFHPITGECKEALEKNHNKEDSPSVIPSEKKDLLGINQEDPVVEVFINGSSLQQSETSKSSSSCRSSSSSSSSSSSDDDESHHSHAAVEKNILMIESITGGYKEDDHYDSKPSDLDRSVKDASAFLEEIKVEAAQDPDGVPPFQDHDSLGSTELEKNSVHQTDLHEDLGAVPSVYSIPLTDDEVVEQNHIFPEAIQEVEETVTITESQVKTDKLVSEITTVPSEAIVTDFPKDSEKDFQSSSVVSDNDLKKSSWISCCGLFELFSGSNR